MVAFGCKARAVCPSCLGRRTSEGAANLVDHVLPDVPIRQFVVTLPFPLRFPLAFDGELLGQVLRRTFSIDIKCGTCGGPLRLIALIKTREVITRILVAMHLSTAVPELHPARAPPSSERAAWDAEDWVS